MNFKVCFLGGGNMAKAIIEGLLEKGFTPGNISVVDRNEPKLEYFRSKGMAAENDTSIVSGNDIVVLSVKPQQMKQMVDKIKETVVNENIYVVTVAAGLIVENYKKWFDSDIRIAKVMPNTPSGVGLGASGVYFSENTDDNAKDITNYILNAVGISVEVEKENLINVVASCAGSSPAYFIRFMESMIDNAKDLGLSDEQASRLVKQTVLGTATMVTKSNDRLSKLRENITSKGGTTAESLRVFNESNIDDIFRKAMLANIKRSEELSEILEKQ